MTAQVCAGWAGSTGGSGRSIGARRQRPLAGRLPASALRRPGRGARRLREVFAGSAPLLAGARRGRGPAGALPALFHLMWRQELVADVTRRLGRRRWRGLPRA